MKIPSVSNRLKRLVPQIGGQLFLEPHYGFAGRIEFANGKISYYYHSTLDINPSGVSRIVKDKAYTSFFLRELGFNTPNEKTFFTERKNKRVQKKSSIVDAQAFAEQIGYPVIVKANSLSLGIGVYFVHQAEDFAHYAEKVLEEDSVGIVQRAYQGNDYRVVVYDNQIFAAYQRVPLSIIGDGETSIQDLVLLKQKALKDSKRDVLLELTDARIQVTLQAQQLSFDSILPLGKKFNLLPNANLSDGGVAVDVTTTIHPYFQAIAINATQKMGLNLCGVDIMCRDLRERDENYVIIELNSSPGLDGYASLSTEHDQKVDDLYLNILRKLENSL
ncbi:MAG: cyanophycin synthetase [Saprospiraceae bacterium]